jgi:hypothetical protein
MDPEQQSQNYQTTPVEPQSQQIRVPAQRGKSKKTLAIALMGFSLALIAGGVLYFMAQRNKTASEPSPTPAYYLGSATEAPTEAPLASPSACPKAFDRTKVVIQIMNGTGIPKEASYLSDILKGLGYTKVTAANSDKQDYSDCEVTFSSNISEGAEIEITAELKKIYKTVKTGRSTTIKNDVEIITGLRTGATSKPSASAIPKASATATPKASVNPKASALPSATPKASATP